MCLEEFFNIYDKLCKESETFIGLAEKFDILEYNEDTQFTYIELDSKNKSVIIHYMGYYDNDEEEIDVPIDVLLNPDKMEDYIKTLKKERDAWRESENQKLMKEIEERERRQYEELKKKFEK